MVISIIIIIIVIFFVVVIVIIVFPGTESVQECSKTHVKANAWRCLFPSVYHDFIFTPTFYINSVYDSWSRINLLHIPCYADKCPDKSVPAMSRWRNAVVALAQSIATSEKHGVFLSQCSAHTTLTKNNFFNHHVATGRKKGDRAIEGNGFTTLQRSLNMWLQHSQSPSILIPPMSIRQGLATCPLTN